MRLVAWWALVSSPCAPVVLVVGWETGATLEGSRYDPVTQTISVLAAEGRTGYWVLTGTLVAVGTCYLLTAWGLRAAGPRGRLAMAGGGLAAILLALFPAPRSGGSLPHGFVVGIGFSLLALWPVLGRDGRENAPWGLRPATSITASSLIWVGALWFGIELWTGGAVGVAERALTTAQALWPAVVVGTCVARQRSAEQPGERSDERAT
ncbi:DUF998 domain-containing protein [Streptomyces polygonati]|uniref:DUF998 domain-containing protein n=1 Tax=Streptomyces polygonati TaxID=1617087 RepID=A0ABV8HU51_9ACTN